MPKKTYPPIQLGQPGEEISRKDLNSLCRRFLHLHWLKLQRLQAWFSPRQRDCIEALPLLFHIDHPALPGYAGPDTPTGISEYRPPAAALRAAKRLARSFTYQRRVRIDPPILGLFLMGSIGSIAFSKGSDLDLWLCHHPELDSDALALLQQKCQQIEAWAEAEGLELHIFMIDPVRFRQGQHTPLSRESAGSTQHFLLLEEFYRTAVHLAGRKLLWWLVPPEHETAYDDYIAHLLQKRFVDSSTVIDLGGLAAVPADEFVSAGLWHLFKALDAPYKSLLKLQLLETYAAEYPNPQWLSNRIKQALFQGHLDPDRLDPYLLLYQKVEAALLAGGQSDLLELTRRSFLLKIKSTKAPFRSEPNLGLQNLLRSWGWNEPALTTETPPKTWRIEQLQREWQALTYSLEGSYQRLRKFAMDHGRSNTADNQDLILLGRKLKAALERRPGKIEVIHLTTGTNAGEPELTLDREQSADGEMLWVLYGNRPQAEPARVLKRTRSLIELLAWARLNHVYGRHSQWFLDPQLSLKKSEFGFLLHVLGQWDRGHRELTLDNYRRPARRIRSDLFLNIGVAARSVSQEGLQVASERFDPFSYGAARTSLVATTQRLSQNSWGEIQVNTFVGLEGLLDCLAQCLNQGKRQAQLRSHCFSSRTLALRVEGLYRQLAETFSTQPDTWFVLRGGRKFYLFNFENNQLQWQQAGDEAGLEATLAQPRNHFTPVVFDDRALEAAPLPLLYRHNQTGRVEIYLQALQGGHEIHVIDERGALFRQRYEDAPETAVLHRYSQFLDNLERRYGNALKVRYFRLTRDAGRNWQIQPLDVVPNPLPGIEVRVYAEETGGVKSSFTVFCNGREFASMELGDRVFKEAANFIRQLRQGQMRYPVFISDLDVPPPVLGVPTEAGVHTAPLLVYKRQTEDRFNQA